MKCVQDLAWVVLSPFLTFGKDPPGQTTEQVLSWLQALDHDPTPLENYLKTVPLSLRLGRYVEVLLRFALLDLWKVQNLYANLPVRKEGRTLGEFDFLFFDPIRKLHVHWEVAAKFYLFRGREGESSTLGDYYGPNGKDRLDLKLNKVFTRQLKLSEIEPARHLLSELGIQSVVAEPWIKGILFYPSSSDWKNEKAPQEVSPQHLRGWWTRFEDWGIPQHHDDSRWMVLPKKDWLLSRFARDESVPPYPLTELKEACRASFEVDPSSILVSEVVLSQPGNQSGNKSGDQELMWVEVSRGFICLE